MERLCPEQLQTQLDTLTSQGAKLGLVTWPYPGRSGRRRERGAEAEKDAHWRLDDLNGLYRQFAEEHPDKVVVIDLNGFASRKGSSRTSYIDGNQMREDGIHFTPESSTSWLAGWRRGSPTSPAGAPLLGPALEGACGMPATKTMGGALLPLTGPFALKEGDLRPQ